jgi:flagellar protein FliO/FliZ
MLLVLILVAASVYGIVFLIKRFQKQPPGNDPFLKLLASVHLGSNRYAQIVSVGSKAWLLGVGDGGVRLISEIEDKEIVDAMLLDDSKKAALAPGRLPDFMSFMHRLGVRQPPANPSAEEIRKRRERLKEL